jgi:hypothetical protein
MKAGLDFGIAEVVGLDGVEIPPDKLHVPREKIRRQDLTQPWTIGIKFEAALCLEVAEHLDSAVAPTLISALVKHSERIYFSAACPGQPGQHHVNCQWPAYWQKLFNQHGFVCDDSLRWQIWDDSRIEPWYRQNIFSARYDAATAGREPRIRAVIHPEVLLSALPESEGFQNHLRQIENGRMGATWYLKTAVRALVEKCKRRLV